MGKAQTELQGFEREVNKRVESVLQVLSDKKKAKTRANNAHKDAESRAIEVLREEKLSQYTSEDLGLTITLDDVEKVKLAAYAPPKEEKLKTKAEA